MKNYIVLIFLIITAAICRAQKGYVRYSYYDEAHEVVKEQYYVKDTIGNKLEGRYQSFFLSGSLKSTGHYSSNQASGNWQYFYENGRIKISGGFSEGQTTGIWTYYFEQGGRRAGGLLENNHKQGEWNYYFENGKIKSRGSYSSDVREGIWNYFYEDGELKAQAFYNSGRGIYTEFYASGKLKMQGLNNDGKSDSLWVYYFESGEKLAEGYYKKGLKTGPWKYYYKNGQVSSEGGYEQGKAIGNWIYYHRDGSKSAEGIQKNGLRDGYWNLYFQTGEIKATGEYEQGTGTYREYYSSGKLRVRGSYKKGKSDGRWLYYDEQGDIEGEALFVDGIGDYVGYYSNGVIKMEGRVSDDKKIGEWKLYKLDGSLAGSYFPLYEEEQPVFLSAETIDASGDKQQYDKPEYRFKSRGMRYFSPVVNEYKGAILSINPLMILLDQLPFYLEYYRQERLGYEINYTLRRKPFFKSRDQLKQGEVFSSGRAISIKQKFYNPDGRFGMLYFGHQAGFEQVVHSAGVKEASNSSAAANVNMRETKFHYGLIAGSRIMRHPGNAGFVIDIFAGVGIGRRSINKQYSDNSHDRYFQHLNQNKTYIPLIFGITFGYLGIKKYEYYP